MTREDIDNWILGYKGFATQWLYYRIQHFSGLEPDTVYYTAEYIETQLNLMFAELARRASND